MSKNLPLTVLGQNLAPFPWYWLCVTAAAAAVPAVSEGRLVLPDKAALALAAARLCSVYSGRLI
jgi:hypothetical protein